MRKGAPEAGQLRPAEQPLLASRPMPTSKLEPADDLRHPSAGGRPTRDSLFYNLILPEEELALQVYTWVDGAGVAGHHVAVYGPGREPLAFDVEGRIAVGDADFDAWRVAGLELRHCEPLHRAEIRYRGDAVSLAYDFTGLHDAFTYSQNPDGCPQWMAEDRFEQAGRVAGEVTVGGRIVAFDRPAHRDHSWGRRHWGLPQHWKWLAAQTGPDLGDDGPGRQTVAVNAMFWIARGEPGVNGYVRRAGGEPVPIVAGRARAGYDDDMTQRSVTATLEDAAGGVTELVMERYGLLRLTSRSDTVVYEAACRATIDGQAGSGQFEALWPAAYVARLTGTAP